jgi:hypothetical protein
MARNGRSEVIYEWTFISDPSLETHLVHIYHIILQKEVQLLLHAQKLVLQARPQPHELDHVCKGGIGAHLSGNDVEECLSLP